MYLWLVCFVVLFGLSELYPWVQGVALPFPVTLLAGVGLAIASNFNHRSRWFEQAPLVPPTVPPAPAASSPSVAPVTENVPLSPAPHRPPLSVRATNDAISFTIRKPGENP